MFLNNGYELPLRQAVVANVFTQEIPPREAWILKKPGKINCLFFQIDEKKAIVHSLIGTGLANFHKERQILAVRQRSPLTNVVPLG